LKSGSARFQRAEPGILPGASSTKPNRGIKGIAAGSPDEHAGSVRSLEQLREDRAALRKELADFDKKMAEAIATESRALLKQRFDYPVFLYEAEKVGISATGEPDLNELYPNDRIPPGIEKTCLELYREFRKDPAPFFVHGLAA